MSSTPLRPCRVLIGLSLLAAAPVAAQTSWTLAPTASVIEVDGEMSEPAWSAATPIDLPWEWFPGDNLQAPVETRCRVTFDPRALYVGCRALDPEPELLRAFYAERDQGPDQDQVVVTLDPFGDRRRAFVFGVTGLGVQRDGVLGSGGLDLDWDTIWDAAAQPGPEGWTVEMAIPFRSLAFPAEGDGRWGVVIERVWPRGSRYRMGSVPLDRDDDCFLCQAGTVEGLVGLEPGRSLELDPTLTLLRTDRRDPFPDGDLEADREDVELGLTVEWDPATDFVAAATVNPDFSQVEADLAVLEVNRRFAIEFPERRPFFLEGAEMFETAGNLELVFTRTVADPVAGAKLVGKRGRHGVAAFVTRDRINNLVLPSPQSSDEVSLRDDVTTAVGRWRIDAGRASVVGALVTDREAAGYHNRMVAIDGLVRPAPAHRLRFHVGGSSTRYPERVAAAAGERDLRGWIAFARYDYDADRWGLEASWRHVGEGFRADAGFVPRVGLRGPEIQVRRTYRTDGSWLDRLDVVAEAQWLERSDGRLVDRKFGAGAGFQGPWQTEVEVRLARRSVAFDDRVFDLDVVEIEAVSRPVGGLSVGLELAAGDEVDSDNARRSTVVELGPTARLRIGRGLDLSWSHRRQALDHRGEPVHRASLHELRAVWHFSIRSFVRAILQRRVLERRPERFDQPVDRRQERLFAQLLYSYEVDPRTAIFAGYTDDWRGDDETDLLRKSRTFFVKLAYALRP